MLVAVGLMLGVSDAGAAMQSATDTDPAAVYVAALSFMTPRLLTVETPARLVHWGLQGLTTIDPNLQIEENAGVVGLRTDSGILGGSARPADDDITGWGAVAANLTTVAADISRKVRAAGADDVMDAFFDELFSHIDPYSRYVPPSDAGEDRARRHGTLHVATLQTRRLDNALLLRVTMFDEGITTRLGAALHAASAARQRPSGLVLDLRGNRGGLVREAVSVAGLLMPAGVVATTAGRDPAAAHVWRTDSAPVDEDLPLVVLVDGRTASAAEILAASLADRGRAVVVGSTTFGKGLVQTIAQLPNGGELFVTWARILAPDGWPLQDLGVMPQVCTSLGPNVVDDTLAALAHGHLPPAAAAALTASRAVRPPLPPDRLIAIRSACPAAEGRSDDLRAAHALFTNPVAYSAALLPHDQGVSAR
jgi:hypothetical protein